MATIQEQLRSRHEPLMDGKSTWVKVPVCTKAADVIDALVEALGKMLGRERRRYDDTPDAVAFFEQNNASAIAALSRARGDNPADS